MNRMNKVTKIAKIIIFLVFFLLLLSCGTGDDFGSKTADFKTGVKELSVTASFPRTVFQDNNWQGPLILKNNAGYDTDNIQVSLIGLDQRLITLADVTLPVNLLEGRSLYLNEGGEERIVFEGTVHQLPAGIDQKQQNYLILVSYSSKVEFSPTVCVDSGLYIVGSGCDFKEINADKTSRTKAQPFSGQGAPVVFNSLEVIPYTGTDSKIELRMKIADRGRGRIKSLRLGRAVLGNIPLQCDFRGRQVSRTNPGVAEFTEKDQHQEIDLVCSGELESNSAYQTALFIELFYDYEFIIKDSLEIRR